jgi:hypothetical protein
MPHNPDDVGVNINDYLGALGRYNQQFGGNQGNQVISSATAPGYAYQNPQTQEIYPLYPEGTEPQGPPQGGGFSGGEGRFHDYLKSIGAQQQDIGYGEQKNWRGGYRTPSRYNNESGMQEWYMGSGYGDTRDFSNPVNQKGWLSQGDMSVYGSPQASYDFGEHAVGGIGAEPGYVDAKGGFLGYGETPDELFANSNPLLQRQYYESLNR